MMEQLIFSLNATMPIFLMMFLGVILRKCYVIDERFASQMNQFVFKVALPVLLFEDLAQVDLQETWDTTFVVFCFIVTLVSICLMAFLSCFFKDRHLRGEFIQASYRSSAALLGVALIQNIYGQSTMGALMIIGSVPLYNIAAVVVLSFFSQETSIEKRDMWKQMIRGIIKNPIIIAIIIGLIWSLTDLKMPNILDKSISSLGVTATPLGLLAMGAKFHMKKAMEKIQPTLIASLMKLFGFCLIFLPVAIGIGFRGEQLIAIMIMLGSATTVSCFVMARNMGYEGVLSSNVVMLTTLLSGFSITFWVWLLKTLSLI